MCTSRENLQSPLEAAVPDNSKDHAPVSPEITTMSEYFESPIHLELSLDHIANPTSVSSAHNNGFTFAFSPILQIFPAPQAFIALLFSSVV